MRRGTISRGRFLPSCTDTHGKRDRGGRKREREREGCSPFRHATPAFACARWRKGRRSVQHLLTPPPGNDWRNLIYHTSGVQISPSPSSSLSSHDAPFPLNTPRPASKCFVFFPLPRRTLVYLKSVLRAASLAHRRWGLGEREGDGRRGTPRGRGCGCERFAVLMRSW